MIRRLSTRDWLALLPVALILALMLAATAGAATASAAPAPSVSAQDNAPVCKTCHAAEEAAWQASTHAKAGATCESCPGAYKEGHPASGTMTLPMDSTTCKTCHDEFRNK